MIAKSVCFRKLSEVCIRKFSTDNMSIKFSANITMMFCEVPTLAERYGAAKAAGFKYVESAFPYFEPLESLRDAKEKAGVEQIVINTWPGKKQFSITIL